MIGGPDFIHKTQINWTTLTTTEHPLVWKHVLVIAGSGMTASRMTIFHGTSTWAILGQFSPLCLWLHYLSTGQFRILVSKNGVGQPLLVRTARTTRSVICWAFWALWSVEEKKEPKFWRGLISCSPPSIRKAHREAAS